MFMNVILYTFDLCNGIMSFTHEQLQLCVCLCACDGHACVYIHVRAFVGTTCAHMVYDMFKVCGYAKTQ